MLMAAICMIFACECNKADALNNVCMVANSYNCYVSFQLATSPNHSVVFYIKSSYYKIPIATNYSYTGL